MNSLKKGSIFKDAFAVYQAYTRRIELQDDALEPHLAEQWMWRLTKSNPVCMNHGECFCGCPIPDLQLADKTCENSCYPEMMDKEAWESYKKEHNITLETIGADFLKVAKDYPALFEK